MSNKLSEMELSRINNISQHNLLALSLDGNMYEMPINNEFATDNDNNKIDNTDNDNNKKSCFENRKKNNFVIIPLHLILHIILLSIFEIILYFHFINNIKNKIFYDKIEQYITSVNFDDKLNNPILANAINIELNSDATVNYFNNLKHIKDESIHARDVYNINLEHKAYFITYILAGFFIFYILVTIFKFELNIKKLILEHIVLLICIGLYEIWFFFNVILKYKLIQSAEINYIVISCLLHRLNELPSINLNSTLINSCSLF